MYSEQKETNKGPIRNRKCTDIICLIIFILFLGFLAFVSIYSYIQGDIDNIAMVIDSDQKACGRGDRADYPFIYVNDPYSLTFYRNTICVKACPTDDVQPVDCFPNHDIKSCKDINKYASVLLASRLCVPKLKNIASKVKFSVKIGYLSESIEDLREVWPMIVLGVAIGILILVIYICIMRVCTKCFVFTMLVLVLVGLILLGFFCWRNHQLLLNENVDYDKTTPDPNDPNADVDEENATEYGREQAQKWKTAAIVLWVLSGIFLLCSLLLCTRIQLAADILASASEFVQAESSVFIIPFFFSIMLMLFLCWWIPTFMMISSVGTLTPDPTSVFMNLTWSSTTTFFLVVFVFAFLWLVSFNFSQETFSIAAMASSWYFERFSEINVGAFTSIGWSFSYHVGTLAFGSVLIAILWFIQLILAYIYQKLKETASTGLGFALKCAICFVSCFERTIKFINKHAYIEVALRNLNFCAAAAKCLTVTSTNFLRFGVLSGLTGLFLFLGNLVISCATTFIMYFIIRWYASAQDLQIDTLAPHFLIFLIVFFVCKIFSHVFEISSDTLLHCYIYDEEDGNVDGFIGENCPVKLKETINKHSVSTKL